MTIVRLVTKFFSRLLERGSFLPTTAVTFRVRCGIRSGKAKVPTIHLWVEGDYMRDHVSAAIFCPTILEFSGIWRDRGPVKASIG